MNVLSDLAARFEAASCRYAAQHNIARDDDWFVLKLQEEVGELAQAWIRRTGRGRSAAAPAQPLDELLADEAADLLGHVLLFAHHNGLDLAAAIRRKWRFEP